jgi:hypothetical protein
MNGAQGRDRTTDTMIFSHVLYQLSYLGTGPADGPKLARVYRKPMRHCPEAQQRKFSSKIRYLLEF